ncbi:GyrI-like domain-containing protein [Zobellia russellii]|uniref:GyrI-like domain-containing protein n=1 Tax=Zobellia russellii TaxID=248907 RepID=UPI001BFF557F|nr:GyrI-like domain-containing protein [Zobellia russellii]MBT9187836.1 GyrI-like domain-containing protein [Zobellia russellii]
MEPRIVELEEKKLVGHALKMSLANNRTFELWSGFMSLKKHITNSIGSDLYSLQVYDTFPGEVGFNPTTEFTKWAVTEVSAYGAYAKDFKTLDLHGGLYAVFIHKGPSSEFAKTMNFIFKEWIPSSKYELDRRPHFEILGEKYKNNQPDSEEEVWIPIKLK